MVRRGTNSQPALTRELLSIISITIACDFRSNSERFFTRIFRKILFLDKLFTKLNVPLYVVSPFFLPWHTAVQH